MIATRPVTSMALRAVAALPTWLATLLFTATYVLAVLLGRATRPAGAPLALVWPAGAVGFLWLVWAVSTRRRVVLHVLAVTALAGVLNAVTGAGPGVGSVLGLAGGAQALVGVLVLRWWQARARTRPWQLHRLDDLRALILGSYGGALAAALIGLTVIHQDSLPGLLTALVAWVLRVGTSTFVFSALALRWLDPRPAVAARPHAATRARVWEAMLLAALMALAYGTVFGATSRLPLAFAMVPLSMWVGMRLSTPTAAAHVTVVGALVVTATLAGHGPFGSGPAMTRALLAQGFITVIGVVTLVLSLHRDERALLIQEAQAAHRLAAEQAELAQEQARRAQEQTQLLTSVLAEMDEGIALVDADGRFIIRNEAALALMGTAASPNSHVQDPSTYGLLNPDGTRCTGPQMAHLRALAGDRVDQDYVLRLPDGELRTLATRAGSLLTPAGQTRALVVFSDVTAVRRAAQDVARARDLFAGVLDAATDLCIISTDVSGQITVFNVGAERLLGYSVAEVLGRTPQFLRAGDDEPPEPALGTRRQVLVTKRGQHVHVMTTTSAMRSAQGEVVGAMSASRDLTVELAAQADLADSEERFRLAFDTAPMGMMMVGLAAGSTGSIVRVNPAMCDLVGYSELDLLGMNVADLSHPDDLDLTRSLLDGHASRDLTQTRVDKRYLHRDGSTVWVRLSTSVVQPHDWEPYSLALIEDITARKHAEQALTHQALHDVLTGLPNRSLLQDRLEHALATAGRDGSRVGVLCLDLDGFKSVNDTAGHAMGDQLLQRVADRIGRCIRPGDTLARLGGDEFVVVCPTLQGGDAAPAGDAAAHLRVVADRILTAMQEPVVLPAGTFCVGVSIGMSVADAHGTPAAMLLQADEAMYAAKRGGKNRVAAHDPQEQVLTARTARVLPELLDALARDEIVMYGQPVVDLATGHVVAVETLVRWQHPTRGLLSPADFLDVAEASTLMIPLGQRVLEESCRLAASWVEQLGAAAPAVHVNVSSRQLQGTQLIDDTMAALARYGLPGSRLVLELTETHMPMITPTLLTSLERLREHGVRIAIDDIGTGYSSLSRLTELPVDILKIDLSFVARLGTDRRCDAVVRAILGIGKALGLSVVAEGVETPEQARLLGRYGCDTVQGYLYSPPRPEHAIITTLAQPGAAELPLLLSVAGVAGVAGVDDLGR